MTWLLDFWESLTFAKLALGFGLFLFSLTVSIVAVGVVMVKIPPNYFSTHYQRDFLPNTRSWMRWSALIAKNVVGVLLILLGIILSLPGVPGQGILTILLGLILLDIPGKRPLEAKIIERPSVLAAINKLRAKYQKPPLEMD